MLFEHNSASLVPENQYLERIESQNRSNYVKSSGESQRYRRLIVEFLMFSTCARNIWLFVMIFLYKIPHFLNDPLTFSPNLPNYGH